MSQKTQSYLPNSSIYATTNSAISSINNKGMANSDGRLFFPDYKRGKSGVKGTKEGGYYASKISYNSIGGFDVYDMSYGLR